MINAFSHICCHLDNTGCQEEIHPWPVLANQILLILSFPLMQQETAPEKSTTSPSTGLVPIFGLGWIVSQERFFPFYPAKFRMSLLGWEGHFLYLPEEKVVPFCQNLLTFWNTTSYFLTKSVSVSV